MQHYIHHLNQQENRLWYKDEEISAGLSRALLQQKVKCMELSLRIYATPNLFCWQGCIKKTNEESGFHLAQGLSAEVCVRAIKQCKSQKSTSSTSTDKNQGENHWLQNGTRLKRLNFAKETRKETWWMLAAQILAGSKQNKLVWIRLGPAPCSSGHNSCKEWISWASLSPPAGLTILLWPLSSTQSSCSLDAFSVLSLFWEQSPETRRFRNRPVWHQNTRHSRNHWDHHSDVWCEQCAGF